MSKFERVLACVTMLLVIFGAWYVADPLLATFQGASPTNTHALQNLGLYHLVVYFTYVGSVWVTWLCTAPKKPEPPYNHMP